MTEEERDGGDMVDARIAAALVDPLVEIADFRRRRAAQPDLRPDEAAQLVEPALRAPIGAVERHEALAIDESAHRLAAQRLFVAQHLPQAPAHVVAVGTPALLQPRARGKLAAPRLADGPIGLLEAALLIHVAPILDRQRDMGIALVDGDAGGQLLAQAAAQDGMIGPRTHVHDARLDLDDIDETIG